MFMSSPAPILASNYAFAVQFLSANCSFLIVYVFNRGRQTMMRVMIRKAFPVRLVKVPIL